MSEKLNCWPGCWAIVAKGERSSGRIVRVKELAPYGYRDHAKCGTPIIFSGKSNRPHWILSEGTVLLAFKSGLVLESPIAADDFLIPLRDSDGQDEMLRIAGLPNKQEHPAAHGGGFFMEKE